MRKRNLSKFKKILIEKRIKLQDERSNFLTTLRDNSTEGSGSRYSTDLADNGTETFNRETASMIIERQNKYLKEIDYALQRIAMNSYGICRICGKEIDEERLLIVPTTNICVNCKNQQKNVRKRNEARKI